jgi:hypothetical protein
MLAGSSFGWDVPAADPDIYDLAHQSKDQTMKTRHINAHDLSTLANICRVAAERFNDHAAEFRKAAPIEQAPEGALIPNGSAAARLAEQFERQSKEAMEFAQLFEAIDPFAVRVAALPNT